MRRREFLTSLGSTALLWPLLAGAQKSAGLPAIGALLTYSQPVQRAACVPAASSAATVAFGPPPGAVLSREKLSRIDGFLNGEIVSGKLPGAIVLIKHRGETVSQYIPSFAGMKVGVEKKDDAGRPMLELVPLRRPVTIEDLLLHTSGITYGFYGHGLVKAAYSGLYSGDFDSAEFVERLARLPLAEQPRTLWDYGHSLDVVGRVIEVVSATASCRGSNGDSACCRVDEADGSRAKQSNQAQDRSAEPLCQAQGHGGREQGYAAAMGGTGRPCKARAGI